VPAGLRFVGDDFRLTRKTGVVGTPTQVETTTFTVEARDAARARTRRTFTITVDPPWPLQITKQADTLAPGTVGQFYATNLFAFGGARPWTWSIIGTLPPGLSLNGNTISGTPSAPGSLSFTARVRSVDGQQAERGFTINSGQSPRSRPWNVSGPLLWARHQAGRGHPRPPPCARSSLEVRLPAES
jgi:Putative Ig domain